MQGSIKTKGVSSRIVELLQSSALGGILLILFTVIALVWANSPARESYNQIWKTHILLGIGSFHLDMHLIHLINDGLMAVFFYMVGLEIKREFIAGELSSGKKATLPILGALGGMFFPALVFSAIIFFTGDTPALKGWGIPMATDIAFSLGVIGLLGKRIPLALKVFLVALAIVDDLGAILVIALFYTSGINLTYLFLGLGLLAFLFLLERLNFRKILIFHLVGIIVWYLFFKSGVHATIAGVLLAFVTPMRRELSLRSFLRKMKNFEMEEHGHTEHTLSQEQQEKIGMIKKQIQRLESPLQRLEHDLHVFVNYFIMPVFALANAGVTFGGGTGGLTAVSMAVAMGLLLGKSFGITFVSWLGCKLGLAELPSGLQWKNLFGVAMLGGIGFTMAIFVSTLAFQDPLYLNSAKTGIFAGSLIAGILGYIMLKKMYPATTGKEASG